MLVLLLNREANLSDVSILEFRPKMEQLSRFTKKAEKEAEMDKFPDDAMNYLLLKSAAKLRGVTIPPNMTAYLSITSQMLMFGTAVNHLMDNIEDTGVLMPFDAIYHEKKQRHIGAYLRFFQTKKRKNATPSVPETEDEMIANWLIKRNRKVKRLLKKVGRKQ